MRTRWMMTGWIGLMVGVCCAAGWAQETTGGQAVAPSDEQLCARALVSAGDPARLDRALAKARRGERVVVGVIGGSITAGAGASSEATRWGNRVAQWWRDSFPAADIVFVNAGIGATGSDLGAHRVQKDLLSHQPDFVGIEFAVNDGGSAIAGETLEGLVRQVLSASNQPAAMLLFTMNNAGGNTQAAHEPVGRHYGLPMVSFRDALWPEVKAGRIAWTDIEADEVHPNDRGHAYCAAFMIDVLEHALVNLPADANLPGVVGLPAPLISDVFEHTALFNRDSLSPTRNDGWTSVDGQYRPAWQADVPGSVLELEVEGKAVSLMFYRIKGAMGIAQAQVDDRPPVTMDAWFGADWGGYTPFQLVARDLDPGPHTLRITLLENMNPASTGHMFQVQAVLTAGAPASGEHNAEP